jgi:hypothetical protein
VAVAGERGRSDVVRLIADGAEDDATEGEGEALRSFDWVALLAERRDEGREFSGGGERGGFEEEFLMMRVGGCLGRRRRVLKAALKRRCS